MKKIIAKLLRTQETRYKSKSEPLFADTPGEGAALIKDLYKEVRDVCDRICAHGVQDYWDDIVSDLVKDINADLSYVFKTDETLAVENGKVIRVSDEYFLRNENSLLSQYDMQLKMIKSCKEEKNISSPIGVVNRFNFPYVRLERNIRNFRARIVKKYGDKNLLLIEKNL